MRIVSFVILTVGILLLAKAGYDEWQGVTRSPRFGSRYSVVASGLSHKIKKTNNPEEFRNAMNYHWFFATMILFVSFIAFRIGKMGEMMDPMAPDRDDNPGLDDE